METKGHQTKFELGAQLGFIGEAGFTSIPQNLYVSGYCEADKDEKSKIRANVEGSSDKYARMIARWLENIGWVRKSPKTVSVEYCGKQYSTAIGSAYEITLEGLRNLKHSSGTSRFKKIPKIVLFEMLATKAPDKDYIRLRRAVIIQSILYKGRTVEEIQAFLLAKGLKVSVSAIEDDIAGLEKIGLTVNKNHSLLRITDEIVGLNIPDNANEKPVSDALEKKELCRICLKHIDHKYLVLIDLAFDGSASREFEIMTIDLLTNELMFKGLRLGESRKPDGIISYNDQGVIIDNKAYSEGYSIPISQADEMVRYIEENHRRDASLNANCWWNSFDPQVTQFFFLFVSSRFTGNFVNQLVNISQRVNIPGGAISIFNLLYLAEKIKSGVMDYPEYFKLFKNEEIIQSI